MATSENYKDFVLEQLARCNDEYLANRFAFSAKKMFGDFCIYIMDSRDLHTLDSSDLPKKVLFLLCDESVFIKKYESLDAIVRENSAFFTLGTPYNGAKEHYIIDIENLALVAKIIENILPFFPTPKSTKAKKPRKPAKDAK